MKIPWLKLFLVLIAAIVLTACSSKSKDRYNEGYRDGERAGYSEGYKDGKRKGYISGTKTTVGESFFPSLAGAIILAIFIISFLIFKKVFDKSIKETVNNFMLALHNLFSYALLKNKVSLLEKTQHNFASLSARTSSLELKDQLGSLVGELRYENEFCLILLKIEQYLIELNELDRFNSVDEIKDTTKLTLASKSLSQAERSQLLKTIEALLVSRISNLHNLSSYKKKSLQQISNTCENFIRHRKRYFFVGWIKRVVFIISVIINIFVFVGIALFVLYS